MIILRRLGRYLRPLWKQIARGFLFMGLYAVFSGFSIGLILPIIDKVFMRSAAGAVQGEALPIHRGLKETWAAMIAAWDATPGLGSRVAAAREAGAAGLARIQDQAAPLEILAWICVITLVAILLKNAADWGRKVAFIRVEQGAAEALRNDLFQHVLHLPLAVHHRYPGGQLLSRLVTDIELVKSFTINTAATFIHNLIQLLVFLGISLWASVHLSVVSFLIVPPIVLVTGQLASKLRRHSGRAQARIAEVTSVISETLANIRVVKGFATEDEEANRFARFTRRYRETMVRLMKLDSLAAPLSEFWGVFIGVAVLYYGGRLVLDPNSPMTPGRFFVFFLALVSMLHPLKVLANVTTRFQRGVAAGERVFEILDLPVEIDAPDALTVDTLERELRFEDVSFSYDGERPVLEHVSFSAPAGSTTALVGPSGGGKTTLVDLIPRFRDPVSGTVSLDGVPLTRLRRKDLRRLIGIVSQETILFNDTVRNNIAYGVNGASPERVEAAARSANADEFIRAMPQGYESLIGERGVFLSGGQRQRLAIARALLRDPTILILDEATSSLDPESEVAVQEALDRLLANRTTFVIAHRLSTVLDADAILVLDRGRIVERGTHRDLLAESTLYRRLYDLQFRDEVEA